jgi:hypothetical protein
MKAKDTTPTAVLKPWRASVFRKKLDRLGRLVAADREAAAVEEFKLNDQQRKRLLIEPVR